MLKNIDGIITESWFDKDCASADQLRFTDPRDGNRKCLMWDEDGAYPFSYYDDKLYIGEESSMHSSPCQKYIEDCVKEDIKENGFDADCSGTFIIDDSEYSLGEYNDGNSKEDRPLLSQVLYTIGYNEEYDTKFCKGVLIWENDEQDNFDEDWDNLYDSLVNWCYDDEDLAWDVYKYIERDAGITNNNISKEYKIINYSEERSDVDFTPYLEAEYEPTNKELDDYIQSSYDSGRYWEYDKIIAMWGGIYGNFGDIVQDLSNQTDIDFSEYYVVYEDEEDETVKCELVSDVLRGFGGDSSNDDNVPHRDTRYDDGFVPHVPSQLGRGNDMNDFYRERKNALQGFLSDRNSKMNKKLAIHDHDGNTVGVMPMAQYNYLRHPYGESIMKNRINKIITESINRFLNNSLYEIARKGEVNDDALMHSRMIELALKYKDVILTKGIGYSPHFTNENARKSFWGAFNDILTPQEKEEYNKRRTERARQRLANMTPEEKEVFNQKKYENERKRLANMTPEEREEYQRKKNEAQIIYREREKKRIANMTPEEKEEYNKRRTESARQRKEKMTPEEREEFKKKNCEREKQRIANMTPEEKEAYLAKERERRKRRLANMTPEERKEYRRKRNEAARKRRASMTPEERDKHNEETRNRMASMTPEERDKHNEETRNRRASMTPEEKEAFRKKNAEIARKRRANMTPEEREAYLAKERERGKRRRELKKLKNKK